MLVSFMITFLCISSVVAILNPLPVLSALRAMAAILGQLPPNRLTLNAHFTSPIIHLEPTHQTATIVTMDTPSAHPYSSHKYSVRSGNISPTIAALLYAGYRSFYWTSTAYPNKIQHAFYLHFNLTNAYLSLDNNRYYGFSFRHQQNMSRRLLCLFQDAKGDPNYKNVEVTITLFSRC